LVPPSDHLILIIILCPSLTAPGLDVHAMAVPQLSLPHDRPGRAVILAPPRSVGEGKDSRWVLDRRRWEVMKPTDAVEVLLCTKEGKLLEGLVTNLYVVTQGGLDTV
jgi:hypothetical protein